MFFSIRNYMGMIFIGLCVASPTAHTTSPENDTTQQALNPISEEIKLLKNNDPDIKRRYEIKDLFIKNMLNSIDKVYLIEARESLASKIPYYFFLNIFPGSLIEQSETEGLILLNEQQAPQLHATIQKLCDKLEIPKPAIFLSGDKKFFNALASSLCDDLSLIVIGEKLLHTLSEEELEITFAHELAHIQKTDIPKLLTYSSISLITIGLIVKELYSKQSNLQKPLKTVTIGNRSEQQQSLIYTPQGIIAIASGLFIGYQLLGRMLSRYIEKEADITSIEITDNPEGFIKMIQKIEDHVQEEFDTYNKDYLYLQEKIEALRKDHPKHAGYLNFFATQYHQGKQALLQEDKESDASTHPSLKTRKAYGNAYAEIKKQAQKKATPLAVPAA